MTEHYDCLENVVVDRSNLKYRKLLELKFVFV